MIPEGRETDEVRSRIAPAHWSRHREGEPKQNQTTLSRRDKAGKSGRPKLLEFTKYLRGKNYRDKEHQGSVEGSPTSVQLTTDQCMCIRKTV